MTESSISPDSECDPGVTECRYQSHGLDMSLRFGAEVVALRPFDVQLRVREEKTPVQAIMVRFVMSGMSMGLNEYRLVKNPEGLWVGRVTLPVCISGRSDWLADFTIDSERRRWHLSQPFVLNPP